LRNLQGIVTCTVVIVRVQLYHIGHCQNTMVVIIILYWTKNNSIVPVWQL